jgi:organic radical activating enzyme
MRTEGQNIKTNRAKTFCVAPWFQIRNQNDMSKRVCCAIKDLPAGEDSKNLTPLEYLNSDDIIDLKKQLSEGKMPSSCDACWQSEKIGVKSVRQTLNGVLTAGNPDQSNWLDSYFKHKKDYSSDLILMADVKMGNTCNHSCVMCSPQDSSLIYNDWMKRKDSPFVKEYTAKDSDYFEKAKFNGFKNKKYSDYIELVIKNNKNLKYLKLLGGEPLLDDKLISALQNLDEAVKKKLQLSFVTNGSIDIVPVLKRIGTFKHIQISISVEGVGKVHEFARAGSSWQSLERNILQTMDSKLCDLVIHHSFQTATILGFNDLLNWCKKHSIKLTGGMVNRPDYLSIRSLPDALRNKIIESMVPNQKYFINRDNIEDNTLSYDNLILMIKDTVYDPALNRKFFKYIEWYQNNKDIPSLRDIFPELYNQSLIS